MKERWKKEEKEAEEKKTEKNKEEVLEVPFSRGLNGACPYFAWNSCWCNIIFLSLQHSFIVPLPKLMFYIVPLLRNGISKSMAFTCQFFWSASSKKKKIFTSLFLVCVENGRGQKSTQVTPFTVFSAIAAVLKRNDRTIFVGKKKVWFSVNEHFCSLSNRQQNCSKLEHT